MISKLFVHVNYLTPGGAAIKFAAPMIQKLRCNLVQSRFYWAPLIEIKDSLFLGKNEFEFSIIIISYFIYRISNIDYVILLLTIIINIIVKIQLFLDKLLLEFLITSNIQSQTSRPKVSCQKISCRVHLLRTHFFKYSLMISVIFYQIWKF